MLDKGKYIQIFGGLLLFFFVFSNSSTNFFQSEFFEEEEERLESQEESEAERVFGYYKGNQGNNIVPDIDFLFDFPETATSLPQHPIVSKSIEIKQNYSSKQRKRYYILYHSLKLDCC